ncbi:hypothetical protein LTS15_010036 [Exophiala xenobiotica]|nr:hypothetical protein LTS15_010036 [Exophiala xenobiotica]
MSFASTSNNKRPSSSRTSSSSSSSTSSSRLPSFEIEGAREDCPTYDAICSSTPMPMPVPVQTQERRLDDDFLDAQSELSTRSYTEDSLEIEIEIGNGNEIEPNDDEELPPYVLLDNGARKPAYSRHEAPSPSPSGRTKPEEEQPQQEPSKFDGVLCPRCNIKKAKTWYHERKQKEREARPKSKPNPKPKVSRTPVHYTRDDLDNATTFAYYMF